MSYSLSRPLSKSLSRSLTTSSATPNYVTAGLVGWWPLNEGTGTTATDASGTGSNGTIANGAWIAAASNSGVALRCNGTSTVVDLGDRASWEFGSNSFTACMWVDDKGGVNGRLFGQQLLGADPGWMWIVGASSTPYSWVTRIDSPGAAFTNTTGFKHIAMVRAGASVTAYVNGVSAGVGTVTGESATGGSNLRIGAGSTDGSTIASYSQCDVFGARLYNRALSTAEMATLVAQRI